MSEWTDETARWYAERYGEYPTNRAAIELAALRPTDVVIDIGCGTASALRHAASVVTEGRLIGIDPIPTMLEIARERVSAHPARDRIELIVAAAHDLPLEDDIADVIFALDSFDHWGVHRARGLAEVARVLAPTGRFIVIKDGGLPKADASGKQFEAMLSEHGLESRHSEAVEFEGVAFHWWEIAHTE